MNIHIQGVLDLKRVLKKYLMYWFGGRPMPMGKPGKLDFFVHWLIASAGAFTYLLLFYLQSIFALSSSPLSSSPLSSLSYTDVYFFYGLLGLLGIYSICFGFLLVWKRSLYTGRPVFLFLSGVMLPAFIVMAVNISKGIGG